MEKNKKLTKANADELSDKKLENVSGGKFDEMAACFALFADCLLGSHLSRVPERFRPGV